MITTQYFSKYLNTDVGKLRLIGSENGLYAILWETDMETRVKIPPNTEIYTDFPLFIETENQLNSYFSGALKQFEISLDLTYGTPFQQKAWLALTKIPYGEVRTYAEQAINIGNPKATRAIGSANGKNPLSIIVPCHRVVATGGKLGGFAGGLHTKQFLLDLESKYKTN
jgi:methylated-DNA-[protein]-cysteine S-methyltransferase